jgi:nickel-type superoxide dismutase maturation protease
VTTNFLKKIALKLPVYKYQIKGNSMLPIFKDGDIVLVNRLSYLFRKPKINDIVAVKDPRDNKILIKRIKKIEEQMYFVVGDNKLSSTDSREFGMIGKNQIVGKVL